MLNRRNVVSAAVGLTALYLLFTDVTNDAESQTSISPSILLRQAILSGAAGFAAHAAYNLIEGLRFIRDGNHVRRARTQHEDIFDAASNIGLGNQRNPPAA